MVSAAFSVDKYLEALSPAQRRTLNALRLLIRRTSPAALERMRDGIPVYEVGEPICAFAALKRCCAFYLFDLNLLTTFRPRLAKLRVSRGRILFRDLRELPLDAICHMVAEASQRCQDRGLTPSERGLTIS